MAVVEVQLGYSGLVALVDEADAEAVLPYSWLAVRNHRTTYVVRRFREGGRQRAQYLHSLITGWPLVDHRNGDGLNNLRINLRPATATQNARNARKRCDGLSRYKGVGPHKALWRARIKVDGKTIGLGYYRDEREAALAYDAAARQLFGAFARLNFPLEMAA